MVTDEDCRGPDRNLLGVQILKAALPPDPRKRPLSPQGRSATHICPGPSLQAPLGVPASPPRSPASDPWPRRRSCGA